MFFVYWDDCHGTGITHLPGPQEKGLNWDEIFMHNGSGPTVSIPYCSPGTVITPNSMNSKLNEPIWQTGERVICALATCYTIFY